MSEKSIFRATAVRRPFFAARPPRADDAGRFDMSRSPLRVGHHERPARRRLSETEKTRLLAGVAHVRTVKGVCIGKTVVASLNETPCLARLAAAFFASHSNTR